jgi:hypothetical protein
MTDFETREKRFEEDIEASLCSTGVEFTRYRYAHTPQMRMSLSA